MAAQTGTFVQQLADGSGATAKGARLAQAGILAKAADGTVRVGVLFDGQGAVVTGAAGMTYNVRKHVAVTKVSEANGPTLVPNDGSVSVSTDPAPGSNSRIDVIWVQQRHLVVDGGSDTVNTPVFGVAKGATAAVPVAPSIPTGALELARVTVSSGTTATSGLTFTQGPVTSPTGAAVHVRGSGLLWGVAFDPSRHIPVVFSNNVDLTPNATGDITLITDLKASFKGVSGAVASPAIASPLLISPSVFADVLGARLYNAGGSALNTGSGSQRVSFTVHGWV